MKNLNWGYWNGQTVVAGPQWGLPELWWHDAAEVYSKNCTVNVDTVSAQRIFIDSHLEAGADRGEWTLRFGWEGKVEAGYWYRLQMRFGNHDALPDLFLYNGRVVWERERDYDPTEGSFPSFYFYAYETCEPVFDMITRLDKNRPEHTLLPPHQGDYEGVNMIMPRAEGEPGEMPPLYSFPEYDSHQCCEKHKSSRMLYNSYRYKENPVIAPIPEGATLSDVLIYEHELYPTRRNAHVLKDLAFDGVVYMPVTYDEKADFNRFCDDSLAQGMKTLILFPLMSKKLFDPSCGDGDFAFCYLSDLLECKNHFLRIPENNDADPDSFIDMGLDGCSDCAKRWLDKCPDGHVMLAFPEIPNSLGAYIGGIRHSNISNLPRYHDILRGGRIAYQNVFAFFKEIRERFDSRMKGYEGRYTVYNHVDYGAYNQAVLQTPSLDGCFGKTGNRGNGNIVLANSRGNARTHERDWGYVFDAWDRLYWYNHTYDSIYYGLLSVFFGGCKKFSDEIYVEEHESEMLTKWSEAWFDFVRFAKVHPSLGKPRVKIGFMRGLGDEWQRAASDSAGWEAETEIVSTEMHFEMMQFAPTTKWRKAFNAYQRTKHVDPRDTYFNDYELLRVPFHNFGHALRTDPEMAFAGTPYGPADFVAWDTPARLLKDFDFIAYLGRGVGTELSQIEALEEYVRDGGTLMIAAGQLRDDRDRFHRDNFCGVTLGATEKLDGNLFTRLSGGKALHSLCNGSPYIVENRFGEGRVILLAGEFLTDIDEEIPASVLRGCLDEIKCVEFGENACRIEYCLTERENGWLLPFINQGRGYYPSGNGRDCGVFRSSVKVDLEKLGMSGKIKVRELSMPHDGTALPVYRDYPFKQEGSVLSFDIELENTLELCIEYDN